MNKLRTVWAAIWGTVSGWLPSFSLAGVWAAVCRFGNYMRASFVALVSSKAAWAAVIAIGIGAYMLGHVMGKHEARGGQVSRVLGFVIPAADPPSATSVALDAANAQLKVALDTAAGWKAETGKKQEEILRLMAELSATKDALKKAQDDLAKRPAVHVAATKKAEPAKAPAAAPWKPFD